MKLADAESESARQRLRESNLDDLENAFKEESPLTESYDGSRQGLQGIQSQDQQDEDDFLDFPKRRDLLPSASEDSTTVADTTPKVSASSGLSNDDPFATAGLVSKNAATTQELNNNNTTTNTDIFRGDDNGTTPQPPVTAFSARRNSDMTGLISHQPNYSSRYGPVNPPRSEYHYQNRRQLAATVIVALAIIGLLIGLLAPGRVAENRFIDNYPSTSPTTDRFDTRMDEVFADATDIINDSMISYPFILRKDCYHRECNSTGIMDGLPVRDRVMHYLVFEDPLFRSWVNRADFDNIERVVQRYTITVFAFETGLIKRIGYSGTFNDEWVTNKWARYDNWLGRGEECDWYGITCKTRSSYVNAEDFKDHTMFTSTTLSRDLPNRPTENLPMITEISLNQNGLEGNLIPELFKLRHLEILELWKAELRGNLSASMKLWGSMRKLWLHETRYLDGTIPSEIGDLIDLQSVFIGGNEITGTIPTQLGNLKNLKTLALHENNLKGKIPFEIANCAMLDRLFLDGNNLNGTIPIALGALTSLTDFRLNDNQLTGVLPIQFGELRNLKVFYIGNNNLRGNIPEVAVLGWQQMSKFT